ncbi:DUF4190 domain-containing protein [Microtetraspora glauca]|uniref:DUF4190 domain-containing protein n=1 Tax=Microtetraspora glauca TaxID=1996 RepID=A0ABV3GA64_MICGL
MSDMQPYQGDPYGRPYTPPQQHWQGGPQYPPYGAQPIYIQAPPTSGYATASLVFGILGVVGGWCAFGIPCVLAVLFGHIALVETKSGRKGGRGMAIAGLILGYVVVIPAVALAVMMFGGSILDAGTN